MKSKIPLFRNTRLYYKKDLNPNCKFNEIFEHLYQQRFVNVSRVIFEKYNLL